MNISVPSSTNLLQDKKRLFLVLLFLALLPYLFISIYTNPAADDFNYASEGMRFNRLHSLLREYLHWNGRYTSNIFILTNPISFHSFIGYKIIPVLLILLTALSYLFFIRVMIGSLISRIDCYILSLVLCLLFLYRMPIISEGIYWYTAAITYQLGNCCALLFIGLLTMFCRKQFVFRSKGLHLALLTIVLFFTIGFDEVTMIALLCFSLIFTFVIYKHKPEHKAFANYLLLITLLFSALVVYAPGNAERAAAEVKESGTLNNHRLIYSLGYSMAQSVRFFFEWISSGPLLILSVLYFFLNRNLLKNRYPFSVSFYMSPVYSLLLLFFVIFICAFPSYWTLGLLGQQRTMNVAYYMFIVLWFINLTVWFNYYESSLRTIPDMSRKEAYILWVIVLGSFLFTGNGYDVMTDIALGKAQSFNKQMTERYELIKSPKDTIYFNAIVNPPKSIFTYDITNDPNHWLNTCYTDYFGCGNKIILKK